MVCAYDPQGMNEAVPLLPEVTWAATAYDAASGADCIIVLTEWNEFRAINLARPRQGNADTEDCRPPQSL